jgi:hypothetical protein
MRSGRTCWHCRTSQSSLSSSQPSLAFRGWRSASECRRWSRWCSSVVLGPHVLGFFGEHRPIADFFAELGKLLLMFSAGLEIDIALFRRAQTRSIIFGLFTTARNAAQTCYRDLAKCCRAFAGKTGEPWI